jgi:glyoxylase-like metal-dependent hydrolase (beta-lactamase superfamily II)
MTTIRYPWETPPENGEMVKIAESVFWLRLPLPMKLDHVNIYILDDGDGWTLIDTGMKSRKVQGIWQHLLDGPLLGKPVKRVVATHHHPDHIGLHGWFVEKFGAEYVSTQVAYLTARMLTLDVQDSYTPEQIDFYRRAGMRADLLAARETDRPFNFSDMVHPIPLGFTRIEEGDVIEMGGRTWDIRVDHGHAPDHASFWSRDDNLVLSGDQVIASISSNIGVYPTEPDANPLADWMHSCTRLQEFAHCDHLALPGHKLPFIGMPLRLKQLLENHYGALDRLRVDLQIPKTAGEVMLAVFKRNIEDGEYSLGLVEALAHCNYLWHAGEVRRTLDHDGAYRWKIK